ncbi:meiosis-specific protein MEI4 isoform X1 [Cheilinus undulatus]|uniref:meiosis-specific protein MEI4 isoform X1 n=1 Tax=Cheilinus undulatus TaxID=241271 RepID=UPI001BD45A2D|nr:meiosis-specific protein MEI4 isoform X1 [Cheilinus undulatus]
MENQQDNSKGAPLAAWIFLRARAALAVALIKNRPPGMSGREHAEALGRTLRSQDESWKKKAQELQQEVLRLRQELLITRMMSDTKSSTEAAGQYSPMDVSQDLFGQEDMACSSDLQPSRNSETPELMLQDPQSGPNPPQPPATASLQENPGCRSGLPHAHFLQSLCALHRVEGSRGLESLWFCSDKDAVSLLVESVCQLLDSVVSACRDPLPLGPSDLVLQGCQVASRAMDLFCSQRLPSVEFTKRVEDSLKELTGMLLNSHRFSGLQAAEKLTEYLITLGSSSMSKSSLIRHILSEISALADQLWQAFQNGPLGQRDFRSSASKSKDGPGLLRVGRFPRGSVPELVLPVLGCGAAPAEVEGTVSSGGGVGSVGLLQPLGTACFSAVQRVSIVLALHVEDRRSAHLLRQTLTLRQVNI